MSLSPPFTPGQPTNKFHEHERCALNVVRFPSPISAPILGRKDLQQRACPLICHSCLIDPPILCLDSSRVSCGTTGAISGLCKRFSEHLNGLRDSGVGVFLPFHFERDVTLVTRISENARDTFVIEVQSVPLATAFIGLGLHKHRFGRDLLEFVVRVLEEIAGVHQRTQPWGIDCVDDAQLAFGAPRKAPMILESEQHAAFLCFFEALLGGLDAPIETVVFGVSGQDWLDSALPHQFVEIFDCIPSAGVEANAWHAKFVGDLDALVSVFNLFAPFLWVRLDEVLMYGQAHKINAPAERVSFQALQVRAMSRCERFALGNVHLPVQYIDAFNTERRGLVDDCFDRYALGLEMPV